LRSLIDDEFLAHATHEGDGILVNGPDVALRPKAAESMSLVLHELTTNAVKHGALAVANGGKIAVKWRLHANGDGKDLRFEWVETSGDRSIAPPKRQGFGTELLTRVLPYEIGAKTALEFQDNGLRFDLELPSEHLMTGNGADE